MWDVQARTRQEKLAAMGRVSAGIAHEIRNPLAAIAQANALMLEDTEDAAQQRLARMVADNVERLKRIVDDVMEAAPGPAGDVIPIDAKALVAQVCADWARTNRVPIGTGGVLQVELPHHPMGVHFDADHLRRVLVNLLDNAYRHASRAPGSVRVRVYEKGAADAALLVVNDGDTIEPDVERHLFEPFFSTRSRGTGLGLYICRELCSRYGARIDYRQRPVHEGSRNEFHVVMRRSELLQPFTAMAAPASRLPTPPKT
jgi:two-component system, NtrC family, sensor histidine kinase PilS